MPLHSSAERAGDCFPGPVCRRYHGLPPRITPAGWSPTGRESCLGLQFSHWISVLTSAWLNFRTPALLLSWIPNISIPRTEQSRTFYCAVPFKPRWKTLSVNVALWTCSQYTFVAVLGVIPTPSQTTCELEPHSMSSPSYNKAVAPATATWHCPPHSGR